MRDQTASIERGRSRLDELAAHAAAFTLPVTKHLTYGTTKPVPEPLPSLPDVLPFDYSYLPDALRDYVKDISERMQCPPDFAAVGVFAMIAAIVGRKVSIRPMRLND